MMQGAGRGWGAVVVAISTAVGVSMAAATRQRGSSAGVSGLVSSAHVLASEAGLEILRAGGNAFDAAVATAAALNVVEPAMSGMGGYGTIVLYHAGSRELWFLNASGRIPAAVNSDVFRAPAPQHVQHRRSAKAISTPGNVRAWEALSRRFGRADWRRLFDPAMRLAADGFVLDAHDASVIADVFDGFPEHARSIFGRENRPLGPGERLVQPDLARSLRLVAEAGADSFYRGALAQSIDRAVRQAEGFLTTRDLERAEAEWWKPIAIPYRDVQVVTASPPANAFDYLVRLGIMSQAAARSQPHNSVEYLHRFAEATKHGFWVRLRYAGDPDIAPPPLERLLSREYWAEQAAAIDPDKARPFAPPGPSAGPGGHTTHFVVADRDGNVVSATQTLGGAFGSRVMPPGTGIWLNDSLSYSTFEPKGNPMDAHAGRRKLSGDCPTILMRGGRPWAALGTPGGHTIGQTVPQMVMNLVDFGMDVQDALAAPRISFAEPDALSVEAAIPEEVRRGLEAKGHKVRVVRALGNAHALTIDYDADGRVREIRGAADPRGKGVARGY